MRRVSLRTRFIVASIVLVAAAVSASVWTLAALSRLASFVDSAIEASDETSSATARFTGALEREDDAVLLAVAGRPGAEDSLERERREVDAALDQIERLASDPKAAELARRLERELGSYREASARVVKASGSRDALVQYHTDANPLLRRVLQTAGEIRSRYFESTRKVAVTSRDEVTRSRQVVLGITLAALLISGIVALRLARVVLDPLRDLSKSAEAIRGGDFSGQVEPRFNDELGDLARTFNQMAADLAEFKRSNLSEVLLARAALEATLEALPDAVLLIDVAGNVIASNGAAKRLAEKPELSALSDLGISDLSPDGLKALADDAEPRTDLGRTIRIERAGSVRRLLPSARGVPGFGTLLVLYDVSELARVDEMRAELVAVASHELKTPITTLRMSLLMLREASSALDARTQALLNEALGGVEQLTGIVDEFLDLTRIEAGKLSLNRERVDLAALAKRAVERWRSPAAEAGLSLVLDDIEEARAAIVDADRARLATVIDNLLGNSIKYTPSGGTVRLSLERGSRETIRLVVADTGRGIPDEFRERVFEKFFRVEHYRPGTDGEPRSAGLGLYLCRQIVELHGGEVMCDVPRVARGTRMVVTLPLIEARRPVSVDDVVATL